MAAAQLARARRRGPPAVTSWLRARGWLVAVALALVAAPVAAQQLLPLRSLAGLEADAECRPTPTSARLPGNRPSEDGSWQTAPPYPVRRDEVRAATVGEAIFVGTGLAMEDGRFESFGDLYRFAPAAGTYETLPDLPVPVDHAALVGHEGDLYVIGGYDRQEPTSSVWRFRPAASEWEELEPLRSPRASPAAAVIGDRIYVVGGSRGTIEMPRSLSSLEIYDVATGTWQRGPDMPTPRHHHGATARDGRLVVVGGRGNEDLSLDAVEEFDPVTRRWRALSPLPMGVGGLAVVSAEGSVIAIGGGDDDARWVTPATWILAPGSTEWRRLADLNAARHGHAAAASGSTVYVFAGAPCPGYGRTDEAESLRVRPTSPR